MDFNSFSAVMMYMGQLVSGLPIEEWAVFELAIETEIITANRYTAYVDDKRLLDLVKKYFHQENIGKKMLVTGTFIESEDGIVLKVSELRLIEDFLNEEEIVNKRKRFVDFSED